MLACLTKTQRLMKSHQKLLIHLKLKVKAKPKWHLHYIQHEVVLHIFRCIYQAKSARHSFQSTYGHWKAHSTRNCLKKKQAADVRENLLGHIAGPSIPVSCFPVASQLLLGRLQIWHEDNTPYLPQIGPQVFRGQLPGSSIQFLELFTYNELFHHEFHKLVLMLYKLENTIIML